MSETLNSLTQLRRELHQCAETGWLEFETTIKIISYLKELGYEVQYGKKLHGERMGLPDNSLLKLHAEAFKAKQYDFDVSEILQGYTGALAVLDTKRPGPTLGLRFDIDANGIDEPKSAVHRPSSEGFSSKNACMMHACGHDGHTAIGLQLAKALKEQEDQLKGKILLIFQPAEEGVRGAKSMVEAGVVEGMDYLFSGHIGFTAKRNQIICGAAGFLGTTKMDIYYYGKPAHAGANPEQGRNALLAAANCAINLHTLTQFSSGAGRVNVGVIKAGSARNIVPHYAKLEIETRGENQAINEEIVRRAKEVIEGCAKMYGVSSEIKLMGSSPAYAACDPEFADYISGLLDDGIITILKNHSLGGSEDIAHMFNKVQDAGGKALYMIFGTELKASHHDAFFDFDEEVLALAYNAYLRIIHVFNG